MAWLRDSLVVLCGGGVGALLRHGVTRLSLAWFGTAFPVGTLVVNVTGSLLMGLLTGWLAMRGDASTAPLRLFLTTGLLGGFTTFSSFSLDTLLLWSRGQYVSAVGYVGVSVAASLAGVVLGLALARTMLS